MIKKHTFQRFELKYLLSKDSSEQLMEFIEGELIPDAYGESTVCSLYFDTPDMLLIRRSVSHPVFKEKLRLRKYISDKGESPVFAEIKRKYLSVVSKRRVEMAESEALSLIGGLRAPTCQIEREISYFSKLYAPLKPSVLISYRRKAMVSADDRLRITFDSDIKFSDSALTLNPPIGTKPIIDNGTILMEIKTPYAIPLWLTEYLSKNKIYRTSFSKYGTVYKTIAENKGDPLYVPSI